MFKRFTAGFAVGYVFGAQAGQKRYEQITDVAQRVADTRVVGTLAERASEWWTPDTARNLLSRIGERVAPGGSGSAEATDDDEEDDGDQAPYDFDDGSDAEGDEEADEESAYDPDDAYDDEGGEVDDQAGAGDDDAGDDDAGDADSGGEPAPEDRRSRAHRARPAADRPSRSGRGHQGGIRKLAASARERGRVD